MSTHRSIGFRGGFSLVEVMIVVAIIGVIASLATYGVVRYLKHAKTAEATRALSNIETGSKAQFQLDVDVGGAGTGPFVHRFCPDSTLNPPSTGLPVGAKVKAPAGDWNDAAWKCLRFSINDPQFYQYKYVGNTTQTGSAATYSATANGDLDGNGVRSTFQLTGRGGANGEAQRVGFTITNEDE